MRILITGSNGFIGSNIANMLSENHQVIGIGRQKTSKLENIQYFQIDISKNDSSDLILDCIGSCDIIIHLAACLDKSSTNIDILNTNVFGTLNILNAAIKLKVKKIINASSLPVIGKPQYIPITEDHITHPETLYHASKLFAENILELGKKHKIDIIHLRISSPIGVGMSEKTFLPVIIKKLFNDEIVEIYGEGSRIQNYINVRDISMYFMKAVEIKSSGIFNIGGTRSISNIELIRLSKKLLKSKSIIRFIDKEDEFDKYIWEISIEKSKCVFGFTPSVDIQSSIMELGNYLSKGKLT